MAIPRWPSLSHVLLGFLKMLLWLSVFTPIETSLIAFEVSNIDLPSITVASEKRWIIDKYVIFELLISH